MQGSAALRANSAHSAVKEAARYTYGIGSGRLGFLTDCS